jgi:hypothetical protein
MENKLISMTDYILEQNSKWSSAGALRNIVKYATFLKQPLKLGMFVPCDENDVPINENSIYDPRSKTGSHTIEEIQQAKDRVLFEGFEVNGYNLYCNQRLFEDVRRLGEYIIEDLVKYDLTLTASAIKQFNI